MGGRKRTRTADHDPEEQEPSPRRAKLSGVRTSTRLAMTSSIRGKSSIIPTLAGTPSITESKNHRGDCSEHGSDIHSSHSGNNILKGRGLVEAALEIVNNADTAELMILELMDKYSFSFARLKELLRENNLHVSFSNVKYVDIAPKVGLDPGTNGTDIPPFEMFRARLPSSVFSQTIADLEVFSCYFNRIVALFSGLLFNTPEAILEGKITTKGRIEYQFKTFGGIAVVFIEVKLDIGSSTERLDCFAQVIAECDACAWANLRNGFNVPILAILCDGEFFYFFKFLDRRQAGGGPQVYLGNFPDGRWRQPIAEMDSADDPTTFLLQTRLLCESLYYVFLRGYQSGLQAYWNRSVERSKSPSRDSTPKWYKATISARQALDEAWSAWELRQEGKVEESNSSAERAHQCLAER
ncbi:uncharacterized protein Z518_05989 [Rhinocladiella mackenziei CBS 650.93]|uniref:Uncharacterized protein n=1 Tax=Rhinocladiella mackenziei CBS 650.93 TaxID=1442369 RepID=A0A0D2FSL1_9EURO|nr:uncharacterized protein Z518_05989 [Rhinocladiella mackenziei CBS 650.93]KIX05117.1 hypothetical protein Z518_05989 [Rhinocladiella mackenziei CBS 650.93]